MEEIKNKLRSLLADALKLNEDQIILETPPNPQLGDFAFPCAKLAAILKKNPAVIAKELEKSIKKPDYLSKIEAKGIFLNFFIDNSKLVLNIFPKVEPLNQENSKKPGKVMVEFSQPNTHKAFHIGHLRNAVLGQALVNCMRKAGYNVVSANYIGDIGSHVAKSLWYLDKFEKKIPKSNRGSWLGDIYVKATKAVEKHPEYKNEIDEVHKKLDLKEKKWIDLWEKTKKWSMDEFNRIYKELNVKFDVFFFESEVSDEGKKIAKSLVDKGLAVKDQGSLLVDLKEYGLDVFLILKTDGTPLYSTKDLELAKRKFEDYKITKSIYVVGSEQELYFRQLFKTLELMGFKNAKNCFHLSYGLVSLSDGKMSSRLGNIITYDALFSEVFDQAKIEVKKRHEDWNKGKIDESARKISLAAIKFSMLSKDSKKTIIFNPNEAIKFEGETGPYLQYVYTRCSSIIKKAGIGQKEIEKADISLLNLALEFELIKILNQFREKIELAAEKYQVHIVTKYLTDLCQTFNNYYSSIRIISEDKNIMKARLFLVLALQKTLKEGLNLIGIETMEEM